MTIKVGDYAIHRDPYRPELVQINKVTEKTVKATPLEGGGSRRERTMQKHMIAAYGEDRAKLEKAIARMISAKAERTRRARQASIWLEAEMSKIIQEVMS